jgi:hypothetical protein
MGRAATAPLYAIPARRLASPETRQRRRWKASRATRPRGAMTIIKGRQLCLGRAVGDQGGGHGCVSRTQALAALATIEFHPTELLVSVT